MWKFGSETELEALFGLAWKQRRSKPRRPSDSARGIVKGGCFACQWILPPGLQVGNPGA